jgi:hypothetical protein
MDKCFNSKSKKVNSLIDIENFTKLPTELEPQNSTLKPKYDSINHITTQFCDLGR